MTPTPHTPLEAGRLSRGLCLCTALLVSSCGGDTLTGWVAEPLGALAARSLGEGSGWSAPSAVLSAQATPVADAEPAPGTGR